MARRLIRLPHRQLALWLVLAAVSTEPAVEAVPWNAVIGQEPLTVHLTIPETLRQAVAEPDESRERNELWLSLEGVRPPAVDVDVRVFINLPEPVRVPSSVEDLHYAGSFTFNRDPGAPERITFLIDLSRVLRRLSPAERQIQGEIAVTFVAGPLRKRDTLGGIVIPFERLRLTAYPPGSPRDTTVSISAGGQCLVAGNTIACHDTSRSEPAERLTVVDWELTSGTTGLSLAVLPSAPSGQISFTGLASGTYQVNPGEWIPAKRVG